MQPSDKQTLFYIWIQLTARQEDVRQHCELGLNPQWNEKAFIMSENTFSKCGCFFSSSHANQGALTWGCCIDRKPEPNYLHLLPLLTWMLCECTCVSLIGVFLGTSWVNCIMCFCGRGHACMYICVCEHRGAWTLRLTGAVPHPPPTRTHTRTHTHTHTQGWREGLKRGSGDTEESDDPDSLSVPPSPAATHCKKNIA